MQKTMTQSQQLRQATHRALKAGDGEALAETLNRAWREAPEDNVESTHRYVKRMTNTYEAQALCCFELRDGEFTARPVTSLPPEVQAAHLAELNRRYAEDGLKRPTQREVSLPDGRTAKRPTRETVGKLHGGRSGGAWSSSRMLTGTEVGDVRGTRVRKDGTQRHTGTGFVKHAVDLMEEAWQDADPEAARKAMKIRWAHRKGDEGEVVRAHRL